MINWIIRHLDAVTDNIQRAQHTQTYEDLVYIKKVLKFIFRKLYYYIAIGLFILTECIGLVFGIFVLYAIFK